jgi:hypothetical protein
MPITINGNGTIAGINTINNVKPVDFFFVMGI